MREKEPPQIGISACRSKLKDLKSGKPGMSRRKMIKDHETLSSDPCISILGHIMPLKVQPQKL